MRKSAVGALSTDALGAAVDRSVKVASGAARRVGRLAGPAVRPFAAAGGAVTATGLAAHGLQRWRQHSRSLVGFPGRWQPRPFRKIRPAGLDDVKGKLNQGRKRAEQALPARRAPARAFQHVPDLHLRPHRQELLWMLALGAGLQSTRVMKRARRVPIQESIDIAVPLEVAYEEWMMLDYLPEGSHRVEKIERNGDGMLEGRLMRSLWPRRWQAEIRDERDDESFAWRSVKGSDCAGLVTFHRLGDRLTRLELQLDVVPVSPWDAIDLALRLADLRARGELRRFKARLETLNPDVYEGGDDFESGDEDAEDEDQQDDHNHKEG